MKDEGKLFRISQFHIDFKFIPEEKTLKAIPSVDKLKESILSLYRQLEDSVQYLPAVDLSLFDIETNRLAFDDCVDDIPAGKARFATALDELGKLIETFLEQRRHWESVMSLDKQIILRKSSTLMKQRNFLTMMHN